MSIERIVSNINRLLQDRGWSKRKLACNMSMPKKRLMRVMNKEENPGKEKLRRIAEAFDVSIMELHRPCVENDSEKSNHNSTYQIAEDGSVIW